MKTKHHFEFTKMVIAGGAMRSLAAIGSIKCLEEENLLSSIKHFVGTSAGSVMCLFLVLGFTAQEMCDFFVTHFQRDDISSISLDDLFTIMDKLGLNLGNNLINFVMSMLHTKMKVKDATFMDLAKHSGKNLIVCVANLTQQKEEYWSVDTTPSMSVVTAIRASCSLPVLFAPVKHNGDLYIDGGIYNNFPIDYFARHQHQPQPSKAHIRDIIGIDVISDSPPNKQDFIGYLSLIFHTIISRLSKPYSSDFTNNIVTLQFKDEAWLPMSGLKVTITKEVLDKYTTIGYIKMKELLQQYEAMYTAELTITDVASSTS